MAESAEPCLTAAEKVIVTPKNLKRDVWKYFGFWAVDCKLVEPTDKVVCKLCKLALAYHSTTSNFSLHLKNVHPSEYGIICETATSGYIFCAVQVRCLRHDRRPARKNDFVHMQGHEACVVDGIGFMEFCEALEPRYRISFYFTFTETRSEE